MRNQRRGRVCFLVMAALLATAEVAQAQTSFTYQGKLTDTGAPANGEYAPIFTLWDAATSGTQIGPPNIFEGLQVEDGLFTVNLDFGAGAFDGSTRWLEISVGGETLTPRQQIRPAPYAMYALNGGTGGWTDKGADIHTMANVGIGTMTPLHPLDVQSSGARTLSVSNLHGSNITQGVYGEALSTKGTGVYGNATAATGLTTGVWGQASSVDGRGVYGRASAISGANSGGYFWSDSTSGQGVFGTAAAGTGFTYGVRGHTASTNGTGVYGYSQAASGVNYGVYGRTNSPDGYAGYFRGGKNYFEGNVGIGITSPLDELHVAGDNATLRLEDTTTPGGFTLIEDAQPTQLRVGKTNNTGGVLLDLNPKPEDNTSYAYVRFFRETDTTGPKAVHFLRGNWTTQASASIGVDGEDSWFQVHGGDVGVGTASPGAKLHVNRTDAGTVLRAQGSGSGTGINVSGNSIGVQVNGLSSTGTAFHAPSITGSGRAASFYGISSNDLLRVHNDGTGVAARFIGEVEIDVLQITGGSDLSEMFDVGGGDEIEPGTVVVIDPERPGRLLPSTSAYDLKVAGVISGAGGVATGMRMGHDGTIADGEHPVALSGRVYCHVDAAEHAINPGDMLTTSDTPGHAMKVIDRDRAQGAIIGKAMTSLQQGETGLVLVLVTLQ